MTLEQIAELRSLLGSATDRGISPYARSVHHNKLADRLIWNGADGGDGDLHALLDIAERFARIAAILEPLRALEAAATRAPWSYWPGYGISPEPGVTLSFDGDDSDYDEDEGGEPPPAPVNTAFVIAARNALPALLLEIQETP